MSKVLLIGAGGVGNVVAHKVAQATEVFSEILLASRNENKCKAIAADVKAATGVSRSRPRAWTPTTCRELVALMREFKPKLVINVALSVPGPADHGRLPSRRRR